MPCGVTGFSWNLDALAPAQADPTLAVDTKVLRGRTGLALTHEVARGGYDLLVRAHGRTRGPAERASAPSTCSCCGSVPVRCGWFRAR